MNKRIWILVFFWLLPFFGRSQELIWEKRIPLSTYERLSYVIKLSDGNYLGIGTSAKWLLFPNVIDGAILMKFNENGDTLWTRWTGYYGGFGGIEKVTDDLFYALLGYWDAPTNSNKIAILPLNGEGDMLGTLPVQVAAGEMLMEMKIKDGCIWISGEKSPSIFYPGGLTFDFLLKKLRMDGSEVFSFVYNGNNQTSRGRGIEFMPNGNILFSGSAGRNIVAFEIDTAGNQVQYRSYFQNPLNTAWQGSVVSQIADGNQIVSGYRSTSPVSYYLGKHDTNGTRIWGGIQPGAIMQTSGNMDSSAIVIIQATTDKLLRIKKDSTIQWEVDFSNTPSGGTKQIRDILYESDQSAVIVGSNSNPGGSNANLYIAKFSGFGIPFNPTSAQTYEKLQTDAGPIPFPNPGTDVVKFTVLAGPGKVQFTDVHGRTVYEGSYLPSKGVSTRRFAPGLYAYKLERNGKIWTGKWVKE
jgi:hypothetical protein